MALMGAIPPPPGVTPNFVNPEHKGKEVITLGILGIFVLASAVIYVPCLGLAKTSILLIFRRISSEKRMRFAIYIVGAFVISYSLATIVLLIFPCRPFARAWDATITSGSCINRPAVYVTTAVSNIVTDLFILVIPIPMVVRLKIPLQQKFGLGCMFAVGSLTFITSVVRLVTLKPLFTNPDQTWVIVTPAIWVVVEANLVIICCCFLALKSFLRHHAPTLIGEKSGTEGYKVNSTYEDRNRTPRGLVITKDVDFNLSWQDDSRVRIHDYPTTDGSAGGNVTSVAGVAVELDVIEQLNRGREKETRGSVGSLAISRVGTAAPTPPLPSTGASDGIKNVVTPMSPV
ncbi:hypothetical protein MMC29_000986 [Sticta canariensis]|nr:hypothetical protein [Sticta canariensis]